MSGFASSGTGTDTLLTVLSGSAALFGENGGSLYIGANSLSALSTTALSPGVTNYVELYLEEDTGGADSRAFWDKTANSGIGAEFSQIVDTFAFTKAVFSINTSSFSADPDKISICEVDVDGSGIITEIRDSRNLYFRLGRRSDPDFIFPWSSRTEPLETQFTGADKSLINDKQWRDAVMDSIRTLNGTDYWFEEPPVIAKGAFENAGLSILSGITNDAKFYWSGTELEITDGNVTPDDADELAAIRILSSTFDLVLTRQDGANAIELDDGEVLWVELPKPLANVTYDAVGGTSSNYRISPRGSVPLNDSTYWLAFREGAKLYLRGLGELEAGEAREINDETGEGLIFSLGFNPEAATTVPYTEFPDGSLLNHEFDNQDGLVEAVSTNTANINDLAEILNTNVYEEKMRVVAGAPANDNEIQFPVLDDDFLTLPLDSRDSNNSQSYIVGAGVLEVYYNGQLLISGEDYEEIGTLGNPSSIIQISFDVDDIDDVFVFRIDTAGGLFTSGAAGSLQDSYNLGNVIVVTSGLPIIIQGPVSEKLLEVYGDIKVTGVIDPKAIMFEPLASDPLEASQTGIWFNTAEEMMITKSDTSVTNVTQILEQAVQPTYLSDLFFNDSGSTIPAWTPVSIDSNGNLILVDVSDADNVHAIVGITTEVIADQDEGLVAYSGRLENVTTTINVGTPAYIDTDGELTDVKPTVDESGFVEGDWMIKIGLVLKNNDNPSNKDLLIRIDSLNQL